jgi:protein ImuB
LQARIGFASNPDLAALAAHAAKPVLAWSASEEDASTHLRALPLSALSPAANTAVLLRLWGIHTLGDLQRLPRQDVALRLGPEGARLWDMAAGGRDRLMRLFRPQLRYCEEEELEHAVESLEPLLFLLRRMLDTLCHRLAESWLVAAAMKLWLGFDDKQQREAHLRIAEPTRDVDLLLRLLHTHMEGITAPAPIIRVALEFLPIRPTGSQMDIFERGMRDPNRFAETLTQIEAIVGQGNAGRVKLLPSRALDAFEMEAFLEEAKQGQDRRKPALQRRAAPAKVGVQSFACQNQCGLPLRRIRPARPVDVTMVKGRPGVLHMTAKSHAIAASSGPWLFSGDWWGDSGWQREVWEVETSEGTLYQLTRHNGQWRLEGAFG